MYVSVVIRKKQKNMSYEQPTSQTNTNPNTLAHEQQRKAEINRRGFGLVANVMGKLPNLVGNGVLRDMTSEADRQRGQRKFVTSPSDIPGGWRRVSGDKGVRLTVVHPEDTQTGGAGYVEVEQAPLQLRNGAFTAGRADRLRVDIDAQNVPHVHGAEQGVAFSVDNPNPQAFGRDFSAAEKLLPRAEVDIEALAAAGPTGAVMQ